MSKIFFNIFKIISKYNNKISFKKNKNIIILNKQQIQNNKNNFCLSNPKIYKNNKKENH